MSGERKYRQQGYKDTGKEPPRPKAGPPPGAGPGVAPALPGSRAVSRCADCGTLVPALTDPAARCLKCGLALHSCRQCAHFDPARRFECAQPIPERIAGKSVRNDCAVFSLRATVERGTPGGPIRPDDARRAFGNLFKK